MAVRHGCAFVNRINASHTQVRVTLQKDVIGLLKMNTMKQAVLCMERYSYTDTMPKDECLLA